MLVADLLLVAAVAWLALSAAWLLRRRRRALAEARWEPRTRALREGGHVVEIVCPGEPAQEVRRIDGSLGWEELGTQLAEAQAEAEARAATLNAARPRDSWPAV
jgi:hypothetical protein